MRRLSLPIGIFAIACGLLANAAPAWAAPATWVSGTGTNAGNCPITAPCKTFQFAHGRTNAGGTINVLSAGSFGPLTITKSISIVAEGVEAAILSGVSAAGIIVNGSGIVVSLRGLTIDLRGTFNHGIDFRSGAALHVHTCVIRRTHVGIRFAPASGISKLHVADSVIADTSSHGIFVVPTGSGGAKAALDRVRVENASTTGIAVDGTTTTGSINATVRDSLSAGNGSSGIRADEGGGGSGTTTVMVDRSASVNNVTGIRALGGVGARIRIGDSTVSGNFGGLAKDNGGVIDSYGTNKVNGNGFDGVPTSVIDMK
jgi:hypothetical protein